MALTLGFIGIIISGMATSLALYRVLGITVPAGSGDVPRVEVKLGGGTVIAWDSVNVTRGFDTGYTVLTGGHRITLAFGMGSPGQVDRVYRDPVAAGHHGYIEPWGVHWRQCYATFHDPDGSPIDPYARLPATRAGVRPTRNRKSRVMCTWSAYPTACVTAAKEGPDLGYSFIVARLNQRVAAGPVGDPHPGPIRDRVRRIHAARTRALQPYPKVVSTRRRRCWADQPVSPVTCVAPALAATA